MSLVRLVQAVGLSLVAALLALVSLTGSQQSATTAVLASVRVSSHSLPCPGCPAGCRLHRSLTQPMLPQEPQVGQVMRNLRVETTKHAQRKHHAHRVSSQEPLVRADPLQLWEEVHFGCNPARTTDNYS